MNSLYTSWKSSKQFIHYYYYYYENAKKKAMGGETAVAAAFMEFWCKIFWDYRNFFTLAPNKSLSAATKTDHDGPKNGQQWQFNREDYIASKPKAWKIFMVNDLRK